MLEVEGDIEKKIPSGGVRINLYLCIRAKLGIMTMLLYFLFPYFFICLPLMFVFVFPSHSLYVPVQYREEQRTIRKTCQKKKHLQ